MCWTIASSRPSSCHFQAKAKAAKISTRGVLKFEASLREPHSIHTHQKYITPNSSNCVITSKAYCLHAGQQQ